jgi:hypothetical protein
LRTLRTYLGRVIRDISRKIEGNAGLEAKFAWLLSLARRVRAQQRGQRGPKIYSLHASEVECIGKGKPHKPYEFGVKVSVATPLKHSKGGQFVAHVKALPGNPYDGHTLAEAIPAIEQLVGHTIERLHSRCRLPRPQCAARLQVQGLYFKAKASSDAANQTRDETPLRRRARHRSSQGRPPNGPQLSLAPPRRRCQRHPRRHRLQLPTPHTMAEDFLAPLTGRPVPSVRYPASVKSQIFTDDCLSMVRAAQSS